MADVTFVLMTCGELSEKQCLAAIEPFRSEIQFFEVRNVCPQIMALNQMIDGVSTDYFIPLDADIVLNEDAWPRIKKALEENKNDPSWHSILFPLFDTLTDRRILALKILRTSVAKDNRFVDGPTPDVEHYKRLTNLGHTCVHRYLNELPIGKHIVCGKHFCYFKYRDVYQTYRFYNFEWDSGAFMGGHDLRSRAKAHFDFFFYKYVETNRKDYLHCIAGMMDGILSPLEPKSKTLADRTYMVKSRKAIETFMNWYLEPMMLSTGQMLF